MEGKVESEVWREKLFRKNDADESTVQIYNKIK